MALKAPSVKTSIVVRMWSMEPWKRFTFSWHLTSDVNENRKSVCFYQNTLIHEERISCHLLKLLVWEVRLAVWNEITYVVLPTRTQKTRRNRCRGEGHLDGLWVWMRVCVSDRPCHSELDEMHQVLAAVTNGAGLEALALTGVTPGGRRESWKLKYPTAWFQTTTIIKQEQSETLDTEREERNEECTRFSAAHKKVQISHPADALCSITAQHSGRVREAHNHFITAFPSSLNNSWPPFFLLLVLQP